ncbi:MAG: SsrA-binding protein SmpB [Phycisphaerales bacterium]
MASGKDKKISEPEITNRRAYHEYHISETLEVGLMLVGTEVKSIRAGRASLAEGWVKADLSPPRLLLMGLHIDEYTAAGRGNLQHRPTRTRTLLAHTREVRKLHDKAQIKGFTLVPLKMYFKGGRVKLLVGVGEGKKAHDKRDTLKKKDAQRDMARAMSRRL